MNWCWIMELQVGKVEDGVLSDLVLPHVHNLFGRALLVG